MASTRLAAALHFGSMAHAAAVTAAARGGPCSRSLRTQYRSAHSAAASSHDEPTADDAASTSRLAPPLRAARQRRAPPVEDLRFPSAPYGPYEIFHLPRTATHDEIKARYYDLVRLMHPDTASSSPSDEAAAPTRSGRKAQAKRAREWEEMQRAYAVLRKPSARRAYDMYGTGWSAGGQRGGQWPSRGSQYAWGKPMDGRGPARTGWQFTGAGHDGFGWQAYAASSPSSFYGYKPRPPGEADAPHDARPRYTSNIRFFGALVVITWALGIAQYGRLSAQRARVVERADREHLSAVKSLEAARDEARSSEGRKRWENLRKRAREMELMRAEGERLGPQANVPLLEAPR